MKQYKTPLLVTILSAMFIFSIYSYCQGLNNDEVFIHNGCREKKLVALTFDDGPHPKETMQVLDILKKYDAKATFFIAGKHANWYPEPLIRASNEGHEIGNHTFNHPDISSLSNAQIEEEIVKCEEVLVKLTGKKPTLFRPPYGSYKKENLSQIASKYNYKIVLWSTIDARDWENPQPQKIANTIIQKVKSGDIILLHDYATDNTVKALDILIPELKKQGYEFVTVSELIK